MAASATITRLAVHPIKGARGCSVQTWQILPTGLRYDREWMVVKDSGKDDVPSKFLSQREKPKLALVVPAMPPEVLAAPDKPVPAGASMTINAPGMPALQVPLEQKPDAPLRLIKVWEWEGKTQDVGDEAAAWFTQFLGVPARLVRYVGSEFAPLITAPAGELVLTRKVEEEYAEDPSAGSLPETRLSDGYPILLASESSLADLNERIAASSETGKDMVPLSIERFRPNVLVSGLPAWAEDKWRTVRFVGAAAAGGAGGAEEVVWKSVKPCARCKVPTIDPLTGELSAGEPSDTLATFRTGAHLGYTTKTFKHAVMFGINIVPAVGQKVNHVVSVGDTVQLSDEQVSF